MDLPSTEHRGPIAGQVVHIIKSYRFPLPFTIFRLYNCSSGK